MDFFISIPTFRNNNIVNNKNIQKLNGLAILLQCRPSSSASRLGSHRRSSHSLSRVWSSSFATGILASVFGRNDLANVVVAGTRSFSRHESLGLLQFDDDDNRTRDWLWPVGNGYRSERTSMGIRNLVYYVVVAILFASGSCPRYSGTGSAMRSLRADF